VHEAALIEKEFMVYVNNLSYDPRDPIYDVPDYPGVQWGIQIFTVRNLYSLRPDHVETTSEDHGIRLICNRLSWAGQQQQAEGRVEARLCWENGAVVWKIQAWHSEPIKSIKLFFQGLPEAALAQGWWQATSDRSQVARPTSELPLRWRYPWPEWQTPWACAGDEREAICLGVRDAQVRAKYLYIHRPPYAKATMVELICEEDAQHWDGHFEAPPMSLRLCHSKSEIDADFAEHLTFVEKAYQIVPFDIRPDIPAWFHDIQLVVTLHGQHWTGYIHNTFDQMGEALRFITQHIPGESLLLYIPGWEGRYYYAYPNYQPGEAMGGPEAFRRFVQLAHELGAHVMPMFGANGANIEMYPDWERAAFRSRTNRYVTLVNCPDWDTDRSGEDNQVFLNPGEPHYRNHLLEQISQVVHEFGVDGVFLDTSACWFNDPRYNLYEGYRVLVDAIHQRHPGLLVAGEGWYDALLSVMPVNQSWLGVERHYRYPQILTRYGRALGHLKDGTPGTGSSGVHEGGFYPATAQRPTFGHIPSLGIADDTLARYGDEIVRICLSAATAQKGGVQLR
jgi:hypothetical protein